MVAEFENRAQAVFVCHYSLSHLRQIGMPMIEFFELALRDNEIEQRSAMCGAVPILPCIVRWLLRVSCNVHSSTPQSSSNFDLLFDHPLNGSLAFPRAGKMSSEFFTCVDTDEQTSTARAPMGNRCSRAFLVSCAGRQIAH